MKILLLGKFRAGKDSVADYLNQSGKRQVHRFAFADKIKEVGQDLYPEEFEGGKPRKFLQWLGNTARQWDRDVWVKYLMRKIKEAENIDCECMTIVITDCRYLNEFEIAKQQGFIPVRVVCDKEIRLKRIHAMGDAFDMEDLNHASETELDGVPVKHIIQNNGTFQDLLHAVNSLVNLLAKEEGIHGLHQRS